MLEPRALFVGRAIRAWSTERETRMERVMYCVEYVEGVWVVMRSFCGTWIDVFYDEAQANDLCIRMNTGNTNPPGWNCVSTDNGHGLFPFDWNSGDWFWDFGDDDSTDLDFGRYS